MNYLINVLQGAKNPVVQSTAVGPFVEVIGSEKKTEKKSFEQDAEVDEEAVFSPCYVNGKFVTIRYNPKKREEEELAFSKMLARLDLKQIRAYLKTHQLSSSAEYQMIVTLGMMDNDLQAERIISGYIRRFGLSSEKSRQLLVQLNYQNALQTWYDKQEIDEFAEEEPTMVEKLNDGFAKFVDEDVLNGGFASTYWSELV